MKKIIYSFISIIGIINIVEIYIYYNYIGRLNEGYSIYYEQNGFFEQIIYTDNEKTILNEIQKHKIICFISLNISCLQYNNLQLRAFRRQSLKRYNVQLFNEKVINKINNIKHKMNDETTQAIIAIYENEITLALSQKNDKEYIEALLEELETEITEYYEMQAFDLASLSVER